MVKKAEFLNVYSENVLGALKGRFVWDNDDEDTMNDKIASIKDLSKGVAGAPEVIITATRYEQGDASIMRLAIRPVKSDDIEGFNTKAKFESLLAAGFYDSFIDFFESYIERMRTYALCKQNLDELNEIAEEYGLRFAHGKKLMAFENGIATVGVGVEAISTFSEFEGNDGFGDNIRYTFNSLADPLDIFASNTPFAKSLKIKSRKSKTALLEPFGV